MQGIVENNVRTQMTDMRLAIEIELSIHQHKIDSLVIQLRNLLDSAKCTAHQTIQLQGNLGKLSIVLREAQEALVKALSVKNKKEGIVITESIYVIKTRIEELKGIVEDQRARNDEYAILISQKSQDSSAVLLIENNYLKPGPDAPLKRGRGRPPKPKEDLHHYPGPSPSWTL